MTEDRNGYYMYLNHFTALVKSGLGLTKVIYPYYFFAGERNYDASIFHGRVERVFIDDHNVPSIR